MNFEDIKNPEELLTFINTNIVYGYIDKKGKKYTNLLDAKWADNWYEKCIVQEGKGVLKTKVGTCFDQVELERLWFKNNNYQFKTFFMWVELKEKNNFSTHAFLIYEKNSKYYWFEHSFEENRGIHEFNSYQEAIKCVKEKYIELINIKEYCSYIKVYEYSEPKPKLSIKAYLRHVTKKLVEV